MTWCRDAHLEIVRRLLGVDLVPQRAKERPVRAALSNSFGFGGTNASLVSASTPERL